MPRGRKRIYTVEEALERRRAKDRERYKRDGPRYCAATHSAWYQRNKEVHLPRSRERHRKSAEIKRKEMLSRGFLSVREEARALGYRSGFERNIVLDLQRNKIPFKYEALKLNYTINHVYSPDFLLDNGIIVEAKGILDPDTRTKMLAVKRHHPELDIRFVFMNSDNKLSKKSKTTYGEWATRAGFPWAEHKIPKEWAAE